MMPSTRLDALSPYLLVAALLLKIVGLEAAGYGTLHHIVDGLAVLVLAHAAARLRIAWWAGGVVLVLEGLPWAMDTLGIAAAGLDLESLLWAISHFTLSALLAHSLIHKGVVRRGELLDTISLYLVSGIGFAELYSLLLSTLPGSIVQVSAPEGQAPTFDIVLYYSFVTQATLGYGDVVPAHRLTRVLSILQSLYGVLFTAIVIGRVVALHVESRRSVSPH